MDNKSGKKNNDLVTAIEAILADLEAKGQISRRTFNKAMLGAGLALGVGGPLLTNCSRNDSSGAPRCPLTEKRTLHFDLSSFVGDYQHTLHVAGTRYSLTAHTADTLAAAKTADSSLANYPDSRITHFVADVELSAGRPQRFHVTSKGPRGDGLAAVALHIPTASRQAARAARIRSNRYGAKAKNRTAGASACAIEDEISDDFHTAQDTAKAILFHHPEIMNLDPDKAAIIENIMDTSAGVFNLANKICTQGPAFTKDPGYLDGWAVLTPIMNDDNTPRLDSRGGRMYDYVFSDPTNAAIKDAVKEVLRLVKDNTDLAGSSYTVQYNNPVVNTAAPALAAKMRDATSSGIQLSSTSPGWNNLVYFCDPVIKTWDQTSRSFTIEYNNMAFLYYGIHVQYLTGDNVPIALAESDLIYSAEAVLSDLAQYFTSLSTAAQGGVGPIGMDGTATSTAYPNSPVVPPDLPEKAADWIANLENETIKFVELCSPPGTVLGLPIPNLNTQLEFTLPEGASKARIMFCGPGQGGNLDHLETVLIGALLTMIVQYAIPTYFLITTTGENEDISLKTLMKDKGLWLQLVLTSKSLVSGILDRDEAHALAIGSSIEALAEKCVNVVLQIMAKGLVLKLMQWMMNKWTSEQLEENIPYLGWALRIGANAGSVLDMITTTVEIASCPAIIENTVSFSQSVVITVYPDPMHNVFPLTARTLEASMTFGGRTFTKTIDLTSEDLARPQLTITLTGIPATDKDEFVEVRLYSDTHWLAANSARRQSDNTWLPGPVLFSNRTASTGGAATAQVWLLENPVPITATTQYSHHQKLIYAGGAYQWQYSSTLPALDTLDCSAAGGLCKLGNISLWVPGGMIGYSWRASSPGVGQCGGSGSGQLYTFKNISFRSDPAVGMKSPDCGFNDPAPIAYDPRPEAPRHYFLDAVNISTASPEYHIRKIVLDASTPVDTSRTESWGRFRIPLDRMAVHPGGYVVGISTQYSKMGVLRIPDQAYSSDAEAMNSTLVLGEGTNSDRLVYRPLALTINRHGVILVLEGGSTKRIKAFNTDGSPCKFFANQTSSVMALPPESGNITWLDLAIDPTDLMFVLSYANAGATVNDYRLDVYKTDGTRIMRNTGIAVARMTMDPWRNLYSLNQEKIAGSPRNEPSVSLWTPSTP